MDAIKKRTDNDFAIKIDNFLNGIIEGFMDRSILITDKWGKEAARYENVNEMLESKFDEFMTEQVDDKGKTSKDRGCSIRGMSRLDYMANKHINARIDLISNRINSEIHKAFNDKINEAEKTIQKSTIKYYMDTIDFEAGLKGKKK